MVMQVRSIISNTISPDIRQKGHLSIRFSRDGFSMLISDASYKPVRMMEYTFEEEVSPELFPAECARILEEEDLLTFEGEKVIIVDSQAVTLVPRQFFDEQRAREILEKAARIEEGDQVHSRLLRDRNLHLVYTVPEKVKKLNEKFQTPCVIIHPSECLVSLADQIKASDHQRGMVIVEVQSWTQDILVIREDQIKLLNRYVLGDPSEFIYHVLNTMKQLELDREVVPVYVSGMIHEEHELYGLLKKYVRFVRTTPYYLEDLTKQQVLQSIFLSEGSKCV